MTKKMTLDLGPSKREAEPRYPTQGGTMEVNSYEHGVPSWADVSSPNTDRVAEFFSALFGWTCPEANPDLGGYRNCSLNGHSVAGITEIMDPNMPPSWTTYINVDNAPTT